MLPRVAIRVSRRHVSALRNVRSDQRVIMIQGLYYVFLTFRSRFLYGGLVSRYFPVVFKVDRVIYVVVSNYATRFDDCETDLRDDRLAFRTVGGGRGFLSRTD